MKMRISLLLTSAFLLLACSTAAQAAESETKKVSEQPTPASSRLVLTSVAPIFNITKTLLIGSNVSVENVPVKARSMRAQSSLFAKQAGRFKEQFKKADAVVTMTKIWPEDSFYTTVREANIRVVNIDASKPWSHTMAGVSVSVSSATGKVSPYFWLSPSNIVRMLNIVATDLQTLYPDQAKIIKANLGREKKSYITLQAEFENELINVTDPLVYSLADEFSYLTNELGIYVDGYFVKQDIDWSERDLNELTNHLKKTGIKVVIHKWSPSEQIKEAITAGGATLVVLDLIEVKGVDLFGETQANIKRLLKALSSK